MDLGSKDYRRGIIISLGISVITILFILFYTIEEETFDYLGQIQMNYFILALFVMLGMWLVEALRIRIIDRALDNEVTLQASLMVYLVGSFVSNITPFTSGGGPLQIYLIHREGVTLTNSTVNVMLRFVQRLVLFAVLGPVCYILYYNRVSLAGMGGVGRTVFNSFLLLSVLVTLATTLVILKPQILTLAVRTLFGLPLLRRLYGYAWVRDAVRRLKGETKKFHHAIWFMAGEKKMVLLKTTVLTVAFWLLFFSIIPVTLAGLGIEFNLLEAYILQFIFYLVLPFMPTPGGSGFAEVGIVSLFAEAVPAGMLGILAVVWRFFTYYLIMGLGGLCTLKMLKEKV